MLKQLEMLSKIKHYYVLVFYDFTILKIFPKIWFTTKNNQMQLRFTVF